MCNVQCAFKSPGSTSYTWWLRASRRSWKLGTRTPADVPICLNSSTENLDKCFHDFLSTHCSTNTDNSIQCIAMLVSLSQHIYIDKSNLCFWSRCACSCTARMNFFAAPLELIPDLMKHIHLVTDIFLTPSCSCWSPTGRCCRRRCQSCCSALSPPPEITKNHQSSWSTPSLKSWVSPPQHPLLLLPPSIPSLPAPPSILKKGESEDFWKIWTKSNLMRDSSCLVVIGVASACGFARNSK